jgi:hypothetical protein
MTEKPPGRRVSGVQGRSREYSDTFIGAPRPVDPRTRGIYSQIPIAR